jgi:hypothetical protein
MNSDLIYTKTASGENAIQQRSRILQRNTRMVLILVDGHSSVGDLGAKIGNVELVEEALSELEEGGFIVLKPPEVPDDFLQNEPNDSLPPEKPPRDSALTERKERAEAPEAGHDSSAPLPQIPEDESEDVPSALPLMYDAKKDVKLSPRFSPPPRTRKKEKPTSEMVSDFGSIESEEEDFPQGSSPLESLSKEDEAPAPSRKPRVGQGKRLVKIFAWIVFALLAGFQLFPFNIFVPDVEDAFSSAIGNPVKLMGLRVNAYPTLELVLRGIKIGEGKNEIEIREIRLQPDLSSWFSSRKFFRKATVLGTDLRLEHIAGLPAIFSSLNNPAKSPKIEDVQFENTNIRFLGLVLQNSDAEIQTDVDGAMQAMEIRSGDGNLALTVTPNAGRIDLAVEAFAWRPHAESSLLSEAIILKGRLENDLLSISDLKVRIFDGLIQGNAVILAGNAKPSVSGSISCEGINASKLGEALGIGRRMAGSITGKMRFTANSETWPEIFSQLTGDGEFTVLRGSIYGADLAEAVRQVSKTPVQGGITTFEQMSGKMRLRQEKNQFYELNIASGLMQSTGYVDIARNGNLTGRMDLLMRGTLTPVVVSGTSSAPAVQAIGTPPFPPPR